MTQLGDLIKQVAQGSTDPYVIDSMVAQANFAEQGGALAQGWASPGLTTTIANAALVQGGGNVVIDDMGVRGYNNQILTFHLQTDGDFFLGSDISAASTTSFCIFTNDQTYNGEAMGSGDVLTGDNTTGAANMLWDKSAKQLKFRGGTTTQAYVDTDGKIYFGGGKGFLSSSGLKFIDITANDTNTISWSHGSGFQSGSIYTYLFSGHTSAGEWGTGKGHQLYLQEEQTSTAENGGGVYGNGVISLFLQDISGGTGLGTGIIINQADETNEVSHINLFVGDWVDGTDTVGSGLNIFRTYCSLGGSLKFEGAGATINEFSTDGTMAGNSDTAVPTEKAVVTYVAAHGGAGGGGNLSRGWMGV
jgi:hypothetical protein